MTAGPFRTEHDTLGTLRIPRDALWGPQTQRAIENFPISGMPMPPPFIHALGRIKACAARVNAELGVLEPDVAAAVETAALAVTAGRHDDAFPVDVFQTGSGTSSNMNANEVIARLASRELGREVHPNDHVNRSQSSNDTIPTAIALSAACEVTATLLPALDHLAARIDARGRELAGVVKTGRTHLMDAMPLTLRQELGAWSAELGSDRARLRDTLARLCRLPQGGTAVGTGVNCPPGFAERICAELGRETGLDLAPATDKLQHMATPGAPLELSGQLNVTATTVLKIANDLRWMNSGPLAGLAEVTLPALQPGSSIMPGKINPVVPEAAAMASAQVAGNHVTVTMAAQSGNFQLNVMLPVIAHNVLQSIRLLAASARLLADRAIDGLAVNVERIEAALARNPILVTALNDRIGYERGAAIAKRAYAEGRPIVEVAAEMTDLPRDELAALLDPRRLTGA